MTLGLKNVIEVLFEMVDIIKKSTPAGWETFL